jgi:acyl carrier protein
MQTTAEQQQILDSVSTVIAEVIGDELELEGPITLTTSFNRDLELESIEFVALADGLQEVYGEQLDFVEWLSDKELDEIIALDVGALVDFIIRCRS